MMDRAELSGGGLEAAEGLAEEVYPPTPAGGVGAGAHTRELSQE